MVDHHHHHQKEATNPVVLVGNNSIQVFGKVLTRLSVFSTA